MEEADRWLIEAEPRLRALSEPGVLPLGVHSASGSTRLEVPMTQYIGAILDPRGAHGLGTLTLEHALTTLLGHGATVANARVYVEVPLGRACQACRTSRVLDLAIVGADFAVAIEHKIRSGETNRRCPEQAGVIRRQGEDTLGLFGDWARARRGELGLGEGSLDLAFVYLTPRGASPSERPGDLSPWRAVSHRDLADAVAPALARGLRPGAYHSLAAFILDLAEAEFDGWMPVFARAAEDLRVGRRLPAANVLQLYRLFTRNPSLMWLLETVR